MNGYYFTANKDIPYNDRRPGEIASVAIDQLKPYREAALTWPIYEIIRFSETSPPRECNVCRECNQNIWFTTDEYGHKYDYNGDEIIALIVAHIRQIHSEMVK